MSVIEIALQEWQTRSAATGAEALEGVFLPNDPSIRILADEFTRTGKLHVRELRSGIELSSTSFVGRVQIGPLSVTIRPKITGLPLMELLRYAYRLRDIELTDITSYATEKRVFQDLVIEQLCHEVANLIARGLHREYEKAHECLSSPRGKLEFSAMARGTAMANAALSCTHYPRTEETHLNQAVAAGLRYAVELTEDIELRARLRALSAMVGLERMSGPLHAGMLREARNLIDRRTRRYEPILLLIELLYRDSGVTMDTARDGVSLQGMLFDMNRLFQRVLSRFLQENLEGYEITDEQQLKEMFEYESGYNPQNRRAPRPRPDFVVRRGKQVVAVLDAKYRDLWKKPLPREMLYQLALYALSYPDCRQATILYPTLSSAASPQKILMHEPLYGRGRAAVVMQPVNLMELVIAIRQGDTILRSRLGAVPVEFRRREQLARWIAFAA